MALPAPKRSAVKSGTFPHIAHPPVGVALRPRNVPIPHSAHSLPNAITDGFQLDSAVLAIQHPYHQHPLSRFKLIAQGNSICNLCGQQCDVNAKPDSEAMRCINIGTEAEKRGVFNIMWCCSENGCTSKVGLDTGICGRCIWNDPGGLCFYDHSEGTHLCYRSTLLDNDPLEAATCRYCRTKAKPFNNENYNQSQFYACFQTSMKECAEFAVCSRCLARDNYNLRKRNGVDGLMPPPLEQPYSPSKMFAFPKSFQEIVDDLNGIDSDSEEGNALEPEEQEAEDEQEEEEEEEENDQKVEDQQVNDLRKFLRNSRDIKHSLKRYPNLPAWGIHAAHLVEIMECSDLRKYPLAHIQRDDEGKIDRLELGASMMAPAQHNTHISFEAKIAFLVLRSDYKFEGEVPLTYNHELQAGRKALPGEHGRDDLCFTDMDIVEFKAEQPREHWIALLAWHIYTGTRSPTSVATWREMVRERCVAHVTVVRLILQGLTMLALDDQWKQLDETTVNLLFLMRPPVITQEWQDVLIRYGASTRAPFLTRISPRCPSTFQLAPNLTEQETIGSPIAATSSSSSPSPLRPNAQWTHDRVQHLLQLVTKMKAKGLQEDALWNQVIRGIKSNSKLFSSLGDCYKENDQKSRQFLRNEWAQRKKRQPDM